MNINKLQSDLTIGEIVFFVFDLKSSLNVGSQVTLKVIQCVIGNQQEIWANAHGTRENL